jgi:hypothetical protein
MACKGRTQKGKPCPFGTFEGSFYCGHHNKSEEAKGIDRYYYSTCPNGITRDQRFEHAKQKYHCLRTQCKVIETRKKMVQEHEEWERVKKKLELKLGKPIEESKDFSLSHPLYVMFDKSLEDGTGIPLKRKAEDELEGASDSKRNKSAAIDVAEH